jgi:hypothetical protein
MDEHKIPVLGGDVYAIKRLHNFFSTPVDQLSPREYSVRLQYELNRFAMFIGSFLFFFVCRNRLIKYHKEAFPIPQKEPRIYKIRSLFAYLVIIPTAFITSSIFAVAQLKRKLIYLDNQNQDYYYSQFQPRTDYSPSERPPLPETIKAPEL